MEENINFNYSAGDSTSLLLSQRFVTRPMIMFSEGTEQQKNNTTSITEISALKIIKILLIQKLYQIVSVLCALNL